MAKFPANCEIGKTYYIAPNFSSSFWSAALVGGFTFPGTTIEQPASGGPHYAVRAIPDIGGLHIEMVYDLKLNPSGAFSSFLTLNGIGIAPATYVTGTAPHLQSSVNSARGAWAMQSTGDAGTKFDFPIGRNGGVVLQNYEKGIIASTYNDNKITIDVSQDLGSHIYDITCRLQIPGAGIDTTQIFTGSGSGFRIENGGATSGFLVLAGDSGPQSGAVFKVKSLYVVSDGFAGVCYGTIDLIIPEDSSVHHGPTCNFFWTPVQSPTENYILQVSTDSGFSSLIQSISTPLNDIDIVMPAGKYFWRVLYKSVAIPSKAFTVASIFPEHDLSHIDSGISRLLTQFKESE